MSLSMRVIASLFWLAFLAFLATSIPHLAYVFRAYEPMNDRFDTAWWGISYGAAISIDVMIALLSYVAGEMQRQRREKHILVIVWVFIVALMLISWFCNWAFAMEHQSSWLRRVVSLPIIFGDVGNLMPLLISAIPVFVIAYTYVSDKIVAEHPKSAEDLEQDADLLERCLLQRQRIMELKQQQKVASIKRFIGGIHEVIQEVKPQVSAMETRTPVDPMHADNEEQDTYSLGSVLLDSKTDPIIEDGAVTAEGADTFETVSDDTVKTRSASLKSMTIKEVAMRLELSESYVRELCQKGKLRRSPRNKSLIIATSVYAFEESRQNDPQGIPVAGIKSNGNGHHIPDVSQLAIIAENHRD